MQRWMAPGVMKRPLALLTVVGVMVSALAGCSTTGKSDALQNSHYRPANMPASARYYYQTAWGIDNLSVSLAASGSLVRFSYRVTNAALAKPLGEKHASPYMVDPVRNVMVKVPVLEQVGALWQTTELENGKRYWIAFSNKDHPIHVGDRVTVVIGDFHADGLMVE